MASVPIHSVSDWRPVVIWKFSKNSESGNKFPRVLRRAGKNIHDLNHWRDDEEIFREHFKNFCTIYSKLSCSSLLACFFFGNV